LIGEQSVEDSWEKHCCGIVLKTLADRDWRLVEDQERFTADICAEIRQRDITDTTQERTAIQRTVMRHYCVIMHAACSGSSVLHQRRAFRELWNYLFPIALYKTHDAQLAQDLTQQSLEKAWKHLAQCQDSASFLAWVGMILLNEVRDWFRKNKRPSADSVEVITETELNRSEDTPAPELNQTPASPGSVEINQVINDDLHRQLLDAIEKCLKDPRQRAILIDSFLNERGYKEIAEVLGITVGNVHVMRHRALRTLRKCEVFIRSLGDYFK